MRIQYPSKNESLKVTPDPILLWPLRHLENQTWSQIIDNWVCYTSIQLEQKNYPNSTDSQNIF